MTRHLVSRIFGVTMTATLLAALAVSVSPPFQGANANPVLDSGSRITIEKKYDGTGHGTPSQTFITQENGYTPGDNTPTDGVVASNDTVLYKVVLDALPGPARTIPLKIDLPEWLELDTASKGAALCPTNPSVNVRVTGTDADPGCDISVTAGKAIQYSFNVFLKAKDTGGLIKEGQTLSVRMMNPKDGKAIKQADAKEVTVVSVPKADMVVRPDDCNLTTKYCYTRPMSSKTGSINLEPTPLSSTTNTTVKGAAAGGKYSGNLDVSSFPAGTTWKVNNVVVEAKDGMLPIASTSGNTVAEYTVTDWGVLRNEGKSFVVRFIPDKGAFDTEDQKNNGNGWQPGDGLGEKDSTQELNGTNSRVGWATPNNDYTEVRVTNYDPPVGAIFQYRIGRPFDGAKLPYDPDNVTWEDTPVNDTRVKHDFDGKYIDSYLVENNDFNLITTAYPNNIRSGASAKVVLAQAWDSTLAYATGAPEVIRKNPYEAFQSSESRVDHNNYRVFWKRGVNVNASGSQRENIGAETRGDGWIESLTPIPGANAVRVELDNVPTNTSDGASTPWTLATPTRLVDKLRNDPRPIHVKTYTNASFKVGTNASSASTLQLNPLVLVPREPSLSTDIELKSYDDKTRVATYSINSSINDLRTSSQTVQERITVTYDACLADTTLAVPENSIGLKIVEHTPGENCGKGNVKPGKYVAAMERAVAMDNFSNGKAIFPELTLKGTVSYRRTSDINNRVIIENIHPTMENVAFDDDNVQHNVPEASVNVSSLSALTPVEEINTPLKWGINLLSGRPGETLPPRETVIVLPGKGNDASFYATLEREGSAAGYEGARSSNFQGDYTLGDVRIVESDNTVDIEVFYTTKANPTLDPSQAGANWTKVKPANATAIKVVQRGGSSVSAANIEYTLIPTGNRKDDVYVSWISATKITGEPTTTTPFPGVEKIISGEISGYVYWAQPTKIVKTPGDNTTNPRINGVEIQLVDKTTNRVVTTTHTNADGFYRFENLNLKEYEVRLVGGPTTHASEHKTETVPAFLAYSVDGGTKNPVRNTASPLTKGKHITENLNYVFTWNDPHISVDKKGKSISCDEQEGVCDVSWTVTPKNTGNTKLTGVSFTDTTSSIVQDVQVTGVVEKYDDKRNVVYYVPLRDAETYEPYTDDQWVLKKDDEKVSEVHLGTGEERPIPFCEPNEAFHIGIYPTLSKKYPDGYKYLDVLARSGNSVFSLDRENHCFKKAPDGYRMRSYGGFALMIRGNDHINPITKRPVPGLPSHPPVSRVKANSNYSFLIEDDTDLENISDYYIQVGSRMNLAKGDGSIELVLGVHPVAVMRAAPHYILLVDTNKIIKPKTNEVLTNNAYTGWRFYSDYRNLITDGKHIYKIVESGNNFSYVKVDGTPILTSKGTHSRYKMEDFGLDPRQFTMRTVFENIDGKDYCILIDEQGNVILYEIKNGALLPLDQGTEEAYSYYNLTFVDGKPKLRVIPIHQIKRLTPSTSPISPSNEKPVGDSIARTYNIPSLNPNKELTYLVKGRVRMSDVNQVFANQVVVSSNETTRLAPTPPRTPSAPTGEITAEHKGDLTGNNTCMVNDSVASDKDQCDQVWAQIPRTTEPVGSLSGFIWNDTQKDDTAGAGEPRMAGAKVTLLDESGKLIGETVTDERGEYRFAGLKPGNYKVVWSPVAVEDGGWVAVQPVAATASDKSVSSDSFESIVVSVSANRETPWVNLGVQQSRAGITVVKMGRLEGASLESAAPDTYNVGDVIDLKVAVLNHQEEPVAIQSFFDHIDAGVQNVRWDQAYEVTNKEEFLKDGKSGLTPIANPSPYTNDAIGNMNYTLRPGEMMVFDGTLIGTVEGDHQDTVTITGMSTVTKTPLTKTSTYKTKFIKATTPDPAKAKIAVEKGFLKDGVFIKDYSVENPDKPVKVTFRVSNIGGDNLRNVGIVDRTVFGKDNVTDITCPGADSNGLFNLNVGQSVDCTGTLRMTPASVHENSVTASGTGVQSGKYVTDSDTFIARAPMILPETGSWGSASYVLAASGVLTLALGAGGYNIIRRTKKKRGRFSK